MSPLCPTSATGTTWWSSASIALTADARAAPSARGVTWQNRCRTFHPTVGASGGVMTQRVVAAPRSLTAHVRTRAPAVTHSAHGTAGCAHLGTNDGSGAGRQRGGGNGRLWCQRTDLGRGGGGRDGRHGVHHPAPLEQRVDRRVQRRVP